MRSTARTVSARFASADRRGTRRPPSRARAAHCRAQRSRLSRHRTRTLSGAHDRPNPDARRHTLASAEGDKRPRSGRDAPNAPDGTHGEARRGQPCSPVFEPRRHPRYRCHRRDEEHRMRRRAVASRALSFCAAQQETRANTDVPQDKALVKERALWSCEREGYARLTV